MRKIIEELKKVLDGTNIDTKGIEEQVIDVRKLAERLVFPTLFEVPGWERIQFFSETFEIFGFDKKSVSLTFEEVELPISVGNEELYYAAGYDYPYSRPSTFLV